MIMDKVITISSSGIKKAIDDLLDENEQLKIELQKKENILKDLEQYVKKRIEELKEEEQTLDIKLTSELNELYTFYGLLLKLKGD